MVLLRSSGAFSGMHVKLANGLTPHNWVAEALIGGAMQSRVQLIVWKLTEYARITNGGVGEWLKPAVLKTVRPERVSGVRIPPPPPRQSWLLFLLAAFCVKDHI